MVKYFYEEENVAIEETHYEMEDEHAKQQPGHFGRSKEFPLVLLELLAAVVSGTW
jgi:hypothetical protein